MTRPRWTLGAAILAAGAIAATVGVLTLPRSTPGRATAETATVASTSAPVPAASGTSPSASLTASPSASPSPSTVITPPFAAPSGKRWKLSFDEEFNGSSLNKSKLSPCFDWNYGACTSTFNHGREHYQPSQVVVSNGTAKLIAAPLKPAFSSNACQTGSCTYKAGLLSTARPKADNGSKYLYSFTYGYVEARIKFPATRGFFTAFWMLPATPSFNYRSEIDILEVLGNDPRSMFMTYHYAGRDQHFYVNSSTGDNGDCPAIDYSKDFTRVGVDWERDHISWYLNGKKCATFSDAAQIENGPMQIILHMMVDNDWQRKWNVGLTDPTLTRQLEVDYLRVFQQVPA